MSESPQALVGATEGGSKLNAACNGLYSASVSDSPSQSPSESHREHKATSPASVRCAVLTVSDTRTEANDTGGNAIVTLLGEHGHEVVFKQIVRDEPDQVRALIAEWIGIGIG